MNVPLIQSVLYQSPYSGCRKFSGWRPQTCQSPPVQTTAPSPYNAPGAILCVDRYTKTWKPYGTPIRPIQLPPRATMTSSVPMQAGRFTVKGPSVTGPFTVVSHRGICWGGSEQWGSTPGGGSGHNMGLG